MSSVRATVLGALRRPDTDEYLVQTLPTPAEPGTARRFVGGGIEFGETSDEALEREFREELDVAVEAGPVLGTVENLYRWDGEAGHDLAVVREARFADASPYDRDAFHGVEDDGSFEYGAAWRSLDDLVDSPEPFYPRCVADLFGDGGTGHLVSVAD
ncbi:NUDIX domain-containing protein [Halorarum salinum]|uniref:NUDIX domain-containing protein n=1 Tax=Halorarum salinum TaxID=2743089 RepID=A0A7D5Q8T7_9EURY|nr:NUDIX domain-containing protein [Halobaculum salinum]QLG60458.1 NUDIX domain-containing protein [Halobaculum salinum]